METSFEEIRFGMVAVSKKFATANQVIAALKIQIKEDLYGGNRRRVGKILLDQGLMTLSQINEVLGVLGVPVD